MPPDAHLTSGLRRATPDDIEALATLKHDTFREAFLEDLAIAYPPADLAIFEAESFGQQRVAAELADPARTTWVSEGANGILRAYAQAGPCKLPHPEAGPQYGELYQLYVRRNAQGLGLGRHLLDTALSWLETTFPGPLWIGVWSGNARAQAIYAARGFGKIGTYHFMVGNHRDDEFIFRRD